MGDNKKRSRERCHQSPKRGMWFQKIGIRFRKINCCVIGKISCGSDFLYFGAAAQDLPYPICNPESLEGG